MSTMKIMIRKCVSLVLLVCSLNSCQINNKDKEIGIKETYHKAELGEDITELITVYLESFSHFDSEKIFIQVSIVQYDAKHKRILLDNVKKDFVGYEEDSSRYFKIAEIRGYKAFIYDPENLVSKESNEKVYIYYKKLQDSIVPAMFNGNKWFIHYRNDTLAEIDMRFTKELIQDKAIKKIKKIEFDFN